MNRRRCRTTCKQTEACITIRSPLFTRFQIESADRIGLCTHTVHLPSGGSIVIDHTEALVSIDINSARATKGDDIEATAFAIRIWRPRTKLRGSCRLRDLGGLLVIDFIDMGPSEKPARCRGPPARSHAHRTAPRVQIGRISVVSGCSRCRGNGCVPRSANRLYQVCPRCSTGSATSAVHRIPGTGDSAPGRRGSAQGTDGKKSSPSCPLKLQPTC